MPVPIDGQLDGWTSLYTRTYMCILLALRLRRCLFSFGCLLVQWRHPPSLPFYVAIPLPICRRVVAHQQDIFATAESTAIAWLWDNPEDLCELCPGKSSARSDPSSWSTGESKSPSSWLPSSSPLSWAVRALVTRLFDLRPLVSLVGLGFGGRRFAILPSAQQIDHLDEITVSDWS